ncbi:hypothetical protein BH09PSE2_BH09PSE2_03810 [soil metagenome]
MRSRIVLSLAAVSAIVALGASPALAAKKKEPTAAGAPAAPAAEKTRSKAQLANDQKMKDCGAKWRGMNAAQKAKYDGLGKAKKDKNGKPESGWIVYSVECRKA